MQRFRHSPNYRRSRKKYSGRCYSIVSPLEKEWEYFITEQEIPEAEITHLSLGNKKRFYIRLGTWNKGLNHYPKTPENIWASAQAGTLRVPRICITLVSERFAKKMVL
jgi:hypothetical protein